MDRLLTKQPAVAAALLLIGAPACACDSAGVIIAANPELEALLGACAAGRSLLDFFAPASIRPAAALLRDAAASLQRQDAVLAARGEEIAVQLGAKPLPLDAGGPGATIVFTDIRRFERSRA